MNIKTTAGVAMLACAAVVVPGAVTAAFGQGFQVAQQEERRFLPRLFGRKDEGNAGGGAGAFSTDTALRLDQLEGQVRTLTGQVEQLSYQVQILTRALEDQGVNMPTSAPMVRQTYDNPPPGSGDGSGTLGEPPQNLGTLRLPGEPAPDGGAAPRPDGPIDLSALNRGVEATLPTAPQPAPDQGGGSPLPGEPAAAVASANDASEVAFNNARTLLSMERFREAESEFRRFVETYPGDPRAGEAHFFIGESLLGRGSHREAANAYLESYTNHPDGSKAPESLLKLGISLQGMGEREAACSSFEELLNSYPNASADVVARARQQRDSVGCS